MKIFIVLVSLFLVSYNGMAQKWETDLEAAKMKAATEHKTIVLVFQGSDWCAPCKKLDKKVWSTSDFQTYAEEHYVMLLADFPRRKKNALPEEQTEKNKLLAEQYNPQGIFPFVVLLDAEGKVMGQTGYQKMGPKEYITHLESFLQ